MKKKRNNLIKKLTTLMLILSLLFAFSSFTASANDEIKVLLDGNPINFDVPAQIINGRTMVPIRAIFEAMGASVRWDDTTKTATATKKNTTVKMKVGSYVVAINDDTKIMDAAPVIIDSRTLAPARYVAESFGYAVEWDNISKTVIIQTNNEANIPKLMTDFNIKYEEEDQEFRVLFGLKNKDGSYITCNGNVRIDIKNNDDVVVFSREYSIDSTMYNSYTMALTGNQKYILCEIRIPLSEVKKAKRTLGKAFIFFNNKDAEFKESDLCTNLPILSGKELGSIDYDKSFSITAYHTFTGEFWRETDITSFEITDIKLNSFGETKVYYKMIGTVDGATYCSFRIQCYDSDGFLLDEVPIFHNNITENKVFKIADDFTAPDGTVRLEFVDG